MDTIENNNDVALFTWECVFCKKCYLRSHDWVFNRFEEYICKFCNQKLDGDPDAPHSKIKQLIQECREELKECTRETCGPLLPGGDCVYHGETKRSE